MRAVKTTFIPKTSRAKLILISVLRPKKKTYGLVAVQSNFKDVGLEFWERNPDAAN
jgi:hypothetical protein